jgi:hypothetical protein
MKTAWSKGNYVLASQKYNFLIRSLGGHNSYATGKEASN